MTKPIENTSNARFLANSYKTKSRDELTRLYDGWAGSYDAHAKVRNSAQPEAVARMFAEVVSEKTAPVLDVGAGTGLIGEYLNRQGYVDLCALDPSEKMLEIAAQKEIYRTHHKAYVGDPLPFEENYFEGIVASGIFTTGHVGITAFPELNRILRPAGKMVFSINVKTLQEAGFDKLIFRNTDANWSLEKVSPEFEMMDSSFSTAKAVVVVLSKQL